MANNTDIEDELLNADYSPEREEDLNKKPNTNTGVKKLNGKPLYIVIFTFLVILLSLGYAMYQRGQMNKHDAEEKEVSKQKSDADGLIRGLLEDLLNKETKQKDNNYSLPFITSIEEDKEIALLPSIEVLPMLDENAEKLRLLRAKLLFDAMNAPTQLKSKVSSSSPTTSTLGNLSALQKLASSTPGMDLAAQLGNLHTGAVEDRVLKNESFIKKSKKSFKYINSTKTKQISPYELKTGSIIPGVLITALNSELPGQVLGQVSENVYDTATGEHLLIPQGTKMIGVYSADVVYGQERLLVAWNRLVFPDGQTLNIGSMNGTDGTGAGGFADQVNNHYFQVFGSAFLLTLFNGDMTVKNGELVIKQENTNTERKETAIEEAAAAVIEKQMDIAPVIEIRSGYQFNIFVTKDMILEPLSD